jgi:hypothetical protein
LVNDLQQNGVLRLAAKIEQKNGLRKRLHLFSGKFNIIKKEKLL